MKNFKIRKGLVLGIILLFIGASITHSIGGIYIERSIFQNIKSNSKLARSRGYIQNLIDNASDGDTIYVPNGTYYENIIINKSINLVGENKLNTIIDGSKFGDVIYVSADGVTISGFTIQNSGWYKDYYDGIDVRSNYNNITDNIFNCNTHGIKLDNSDGNTIYDNRFISHFYSEIWVHYSKNNTIVGNDLFSIQNNDSVYKRAMCISYSNNNTILGNTIFSKTKQSGYCSCIDIDRNSDGNSILENKIILEFSYGIRLWTVSNNLIIGNTIISNNNSIGIDLRSSDGNILSRNFISHTWCSIDIDYSNNNTINDNNLISNYRGISSYRSNNVSIVHNNIILNEEFGITLASSNGNIIEKNNFQNNKINAVFLNCTNTWRKNYWNRPRLFPKLIFGVKTIKTDLGIDIPIPLLDFDNRPALKPYDI